MSKLDSSAKLKKKLWNKLRNLDHKISKIAKWNLQGKWVFIFPQSEKQFHVLDEQRKAVRIALKTIAVPAYAKAKVYH